MKKFLLASVSVVSLSCGVCAGEFTLDDKFDTNQEMSLSDLAKRSTPVREIGGDKRKKLDTPPQQIPNAGAYLVVMNDIAQVKQSLLASESFLLKQEHFQHEKDISDAVYDYYISYRPINLKRDKRLDQALSAWFRAEKMELSSSCVQGIWQEDKKINGHYSIAPNTEGYPSIALKYKDGSASNIVLPIYRDRRGLDRDLYIKKGSSFKALSKSDVRLLEFLNDSLFKKISYKKSFKETLGDYLNGASNPKSLVPINGGLRPEELYLRDFLLYYTFHEGKHNKSRLSHVEKTKVPNNIVDFWRQNRGRPLGIYGNQYDIGLNYNNALSLIVRTSKAAIPIFKEDRNRPDFALPYAYTRSEENRLSGLFWLKRHLNKAFILNDALLGLSNEEHNPYKKSLLKMAQQLTDGLIINVKDRDTEETLELLNFLISSSFIYNQTAIDWIKTNRHHNPTYFDTLLSLDLLRNTNRGHASSLSNE